MFLLILVSPVDRAFGAQRFSGGRAGRRFAPPSAAHPPTPPITSTLFALTSIPILAYLGLGFEVWGLGFEVLGPGFDVLVLGFEVLGVQIHDLGIQIHDLGIQVQSLKPDPGSAKPGL